MDVITHNLLPFLGILIVLVVVHEAGHFFTAKLFGVKVLEFGIGYPPRIWGFKRGETEYTVNALPLGGFVRLLGEEDPTEPRSLAAQKAWKRLVIMGAGAFMNFVLAVALFTAVWIIPRQVNVGQAVITQVVPGSPAEQAGIKTGDIIETINGRTIENVSDASYNIQLNLGDNIPITLRRTDPVTKEVSDVTVHVTPRWAPPPYVYTVSPGETVNDVVRATGYDAATVRQAAAIDTTLPVGQPLSITTEAGDVVQYTVQEGDTLDKVSRQLHATEASIAAAAGLPNPDQLQPGPLQFAQGATGIRIAPQYPFTESRSLGPLAALQRGWRDTFDSLKLARNEIYSWIKGGTSAPVSGPIGIAQATGEVVKQAGWKSLIDLAALLSINLAVLNVLPLPMLDGGRMAFVVVEIARRGRRIAPEKEALVHLVGMAAILLLVAVLSYFDIVRIVDGKSLFR